ncbi:MAG: hypothetical protein HW390_2740 [Candidatus Brocadiaceae bacterium]|nr:hypothetical protein [Candidatus Brocadiaceae bacterium]
MGLAPRLLYVSIRKWTEREIYVTTLWVLFAKGNSSGNTRYKPAGIFTWGEESGLKKRGTSSMCPSFTVIIPDLITRVIDTLYLAPVVACGGTGVAGGAQATLIMERIMW